MSRFATLVAVLSTALGCAEPGPPAQPNLLVVVIDTLRADHVGAYGSHGGATPRIDELAARSLVVEHAWSQSSWTKPAIASLMTSLHERSHGVHQGFSDRLAAPLETLAELLAAAGYRTGAVSENPHVNPAFGFDQGFGFFEGRKDFRGSAVVSAERALQWLADLPEHTPFFLYLHLVDPHGPYTPAANVREMVTEGLTAERPLVEAGRINQLLDGEKAVALAPGDVRFLEALYDGELRTTDAVVGAVLDHLELRNLSDKTIVLVTSDHGEEFMEHGSLKHGYWLYEESVRIPLILHVPGAEPRRSEETWVQLVDVAPTLLELLGIEAPSTFEGRSFAPLLRGSELGEQPLVFETRYRGVARRALRDGRHKLIIDDKTGARELYDLEADPTEQDDLALRHPDVARELESRMQAAHRGSPGQGEQRDEGLDPSIRAALEHLGYVEGRSESGRELRKADRKADRKGSGRGDRKGDGKGDRNSDEMGQRATSNSR
jgi:arylsulfatase A-like enzyme